MGFALMKAALPTSFDNIQCFIFLVTNFVIAHFLEIFSKSLCVLLSYLFVVTQLSSDPKNQNLLF